MLSGCRTMMVMFGDNIRYSISGQVQDSAIPNLKGIADVNVSLECPGAENSIYQNRKGKTDQNGHYQLSGYWELRDCRISFAHEHYKTTVINIEQSHLIKSEGLSREYEVNARLEKKTIQ
jgi:hypothetical protein